MSWKDLEKQTLLRRLIGPKVPKQTETACTHPWEWYSIDTGFGMFRCCPRQQYRPVEKGEIIFNNHKHLQEVRTALVNGEKHPSCNDCWKAEATGGKSYRKVLESDVWPISGVEPVKIKAPRWIEIKFSNLCNIKCATCHPICSSLWEEEIGMEPDAKKLMQLKNKPEDNHKQFFEWVEAHFDDIETFQLFGGEPVLHDDFYPLMDMIIEKTKNSKKKKHVSYSTNGNWPEKYRKKHYEYVTRLLEAGNNFFIRFSIDGVGEQGEYIRDNLDWPKFENNFKEYYNNFWDTPHPTEVEPKTGKPKLKWEKQIWRLRCNIALSILNVLYLDKICQWLDDNTPDVEPHYNFVSVPTKFYMRNWGRLLKPMKKIITMQDYRRYGKYKNHVLDMIDSYSNLEPNYEEIHKLKEFLDAYDKKKGTNFIELFPMNKLLFRGVPGIELPPEPDPVPEPVVTHSDPIRELLEKRVDVTWKNGKLYDSKGRELDRTGVKIQRT